ncbi:Branched-chain amino acid transport ATP-binding protein LivG [Candidatus Rhodobacter oscarellae]|uniref:Branched-chain amino acid transport ATP-binding protein LivG n=1 Tax=Candidatus Rhodobacter oscarellae TaxID=1675527 RepID=A0A0J9E940_9RHOB|nr:ATP-binding cassette domain-containing protein [Candidatus Rhodobacter lobularis]KMW59310.1 Branched-chain amino acid transport ATP-binding protein LivG [Candidatus Rhodobacter lobularis]
MSARLQVSNLVKRFGGLTATNDMSFTVEPGESVGLIGPNGAGKTTIFSQIMGEHRQTSGQIHMGEQEISALSTPARIRRGVSRTYQVPRPFPEITVAENIRVGLMPDSVWQMVTRGADRDRERELALAVGFAEADLDRTPAELSMGDLRKLEMARTLATDPKVMLLDEVFAGLTVGEIATISALVQKLRDQGMTFLIVSHDLKALEPLIDRAIAIDRGTKIAEGAYSEVIADAGVRASYLGGGGDA